MNGIVKYFRDLRIEFQKWNFNRKYTSGDKIDLDRQTKAIEKARKLSKRRKVRLWVVRLFPGKYRICTKADVKGILRNNGISTNINLFALNEVIVHITKYGK